jgi:hypothetical protein
MSSLLEYVRKGFDKVWSGIGSMKSQLDELQGRIGTLENVGDEIDQIEGRRVPYWLQGDDTFIATQAGQAGNAISMTISQDGPFIWTHYPYCVWRPSAPANATLFGHWRPVSAWPFPVQAADAAGVVDLNEDFISLSYTVIDGGSQRNLSNAAIPPLLSRPDKYIPLPHRMLFTPNSVVTFTPVYRAISFNNGTVPPTQGTLEVVFPGFRIVNL